ncbi:MAG: class I SAM-dependent methyltransferase [Candidatus Marsarchaeota archaeon]|jgi:ubiquinone/menaquinone biosynthesis C-methylase UbiE|nr:class I SAM-dependent methyltransferase [Candidatus Marsarchaeota archaeon]MCL5418585.1 class I SAM-dependent methyltransferase [Candidatus Marsarchaeota archaeon]
MKQLSKNIYVEKDFVEKYSNALKDDKFHQFEDKPAMHKMIGNVKGNSVLCIGCGNGDECEYIRKKGARRVVGIDLSKSMIRTAKSKHKGIEFYAMSVAKLSFKDNEFGMLYSDLVMHYMSDRGPAMKEAYRVLKPNGRFVFSDIHPIHDMLERKEEGNTKQALFGYIRKGRKYRFIGNYFSHGVRGSEWFKGYVVKSYKETFSSMLMPAIRAGFVLRSIVEPKPLKALKKIDKERYNKLSRIPEALIFELAKPG